MCKYYAILYKNLTRVQTVVSAGIQNEFLADTDNCFFFPLLA